MQNKRIRALLSPRYNWLMLALDIVAIVACALRLNIYTAFFVLLDLCFALQNGVTFHGYRLQNSKKLDPAQNEGILRLESNNIGKVLAALCYLGFYYFPVRNCAKFGSNVLAVALMIVLYFILAQVYYQFQRRRQN